MRIIRAACALSLVCVSSCDPYAPSLAGTAEPITETCCGGIGLCVQPEFVPAADAERLGQADCQRDALACVPLAWLEDPTTGPSACRTEGELEGRCLPSCLPELQQRADRFAQQDCEAGHLCVPCYDPITGEDTRACRFEPDPGPSEEPPELTSP